MLKDKKKLANEKNQDDQDPVNRRSNQRGLWSIFADYEEFIVLDQQLEERFANRRRARIGVGYRLNYKHRFDLGYTRQTSRNEIDDDYTGTDNVIQLKYKMFLNPSKPVTTK